jgi:hypothetical protein
MLLTKLHRGIKVWTEVGITFVDILCLMDFIYGRQDGVCKKNIERHRTVQSVAWFPDGKG